MDRSIHVLIVDDQPTIRQIIRGFLRHLGFNNVTEADNGSRAWDIINTRRIDFIISDWVMEGMTGLDLLLAVRREYDFKDIPFLMVTAETGHAQIVDAAKAGVSDYIVKPFNADMLKTKIERIFSK